MASTPKMARTVLVNANRSWLAVSRSSKSAWSLASSRPLPHDVLVCRGGARVFTSCFYTDGAFEAAREHLASRPVTFPKRAPEFPEGLDEAYAALADISVEALAKFDALYDVEDGCYVYTWAGLEQRRELAHPIPGPVPDASSDLVLLEASCSFDAAKWIERYPELREQVAAAPWPAHWLSCNFLPVGDLREWVGCGSSSKPAPGRRTVGDPDRAGAEVWIPYDEGCAGRYVRVELTREDG